VRRGNEDLVNVLPGVKSPKDDKRILIGEFDWNSSLSVPLEMLLVSRLVNELHPGISVSFTVSQSILVISVTNYYQVACRWRDKSRSSTSLKPFCIATIHLRGLQNRLQQSKQRIFITR